MGCEGIMSFLLFFIPAAVFFAIYEIQLRRLHRKIEESAFAGLLDED
jgi:hypothetical protein